MNNQKKIETQNLSSLNYHCSAFENLSSRQLLDKDFELTAATSNSISVCDSSGLASLDMELWQPSLPSSTAISSMMSDKPSHQFMSPFTDLNTDSCSSSLGYPQQFFQPWQQNLFLQLPQKSSQFSEVGLCHDHYMSDLENTNSSDSSLFGNSRTCLTIPLCRNSHSRCSDNVRTNQEYHSKHPHQFHVNTHRVEHPSLDWAQLTAIEIPSRVTCQSIGPLVNPRPQHGEQSLESLVGVTVFHSPVPSAVAVSNKPRIRWTADLHEQFVKVVNLLGGAMKATPKGILKLMNSKELTIFHIKSHLQKYRNAKCNPIFLEGKNGRRASQKAIPMLNLKANEGLHITEALRLQMDVQKTLHEQLEIQRNLQMRIKEHMAHLQKIFDQQSRSYILLESQGSENVEDHCCSLERLSARNGDYVEVRVDKTEESRFISNIDWK